MPNEGALEQKLGDAIADGRITDHDADQVRRFAEWLSKSGPPPPYGSKRGDEVWLNWRDNVLTAEQRAFHIFASGDPEWREYLGLPPLAKDAADA